jgi:ubiquitin-activating enzyme E1
MFETQYTNDKQIDMSMYDRQIRIVGLDASKKICNSSVCIIGLNGGYGTEIAKNLALCGIKTLYLNDENIITQDDLVTGYYYSQDDIGKPKSYILSKKINELNPYIKTIIIKSDNDINNTNVIIVVNKDYNTILKYSAFARKNNMKFICLNSHKFIGHIFVDAGSHHSINEVSSENYEPIQILNIDKDGIITTNGHEFQYGDTVELYNIQGYNIECLLNKQFKIEIINKYKFKLINFIDNNFTFLNNNFTFLNGTVKYIPIPITINHNSIDTFKDNIFTKFNYVNDENIAVVSIMGSIVASETIKLISNKYTPISQFFDWEEVITGSYKETISDSEWFVVGSGAIGCELLKNLAYLNVKKIKVTDPDTIEKSNLSRQFLFRSSDIGELKSQVASNKVKLMNPNIEIQYYSEKVGNDNKTFTDNILKDTKLSGVFNALDNISARKFMDDQCFNYNKALFESGTLGTKGNTQPVIPFITETYSNSNDPVQEKSFPICTIKNFPNEITHTIHWAMDQFEFYNRGPNNLKNWLENKNIVFPQTTEGLQMNNDVYMFSTKYNVTNWLNCVIWALDMFYENYNYNIKQLLHNFPKDTLTSEGNLFWSSGKRCPTPLMFDIHNKLHIDYIESTVKILCNILTLDSNFTDDELKDQIKNYKYKEFTLENNKINNFHSLNDNYNIKNINTQVFEKDNDENYHIKWIMTASNLRATNYEIIPVDFYTTKGIAGKIIPAISTTTSVVAGLIIIEMLKYLEKAPLEKYKSTFVNLADNLIISAEPIKAPNVTICGNEYNSWFKFNHNGDCLLSEFKKKYDEIFKSEITMIAYGSSLLYSNFTNSDENLNKLFSDILKDHDKDIDLSNQIELIIMCEDDTLEIPPIIFTM